MAQTQRRGDGNEHEARIPDRREINPTDTVWEHAIKPVLFTGSPDHNGWWVVRQALPQQVVPCHLRSCSEGPVNTTGTSIGELYRQPCFANTAGTSERQYAHVLLDQKLLRCLELAGTTQQELAGTTQHWPESQPTSGGVSRSARLQCVRG